VETKNKYQLPVKGNVKIDTSSPAHVGNLKNSIDFLCEEGTEVFAALDGEVVEVKDDSKISGEDKKYEKDGNYIEIKHANGEYSEYEHLKFKSAKVKVGDKVRKGQLIALSGATGWLAHLGAHLHFMVGEYGKTIKDYETLEIKWQIK